MRGCGMFGNTGNLGFMVGKDDRDDGKTRGEKRQEKRRRARKMGVSGKSYVNAVRNAMLKRKAEIEIRDRKIK